MAAGIYRAEDRLCVWRHCKLRDEDIMIADQVPEPICTLRDGIPAHDHVEILVDGAVVGLGKCVLVSDLMPDSVATAIAEAECAILAAVEGLTKCRYLSHVRPMLDAECTDAFNKLVEAQARLTFLRNPRPFKATP